jgi:hypothetical protein
MMRIMRGLGHAQYVREQMLPVLQEYLQHVSGPGLTHGIEYAPGLKGDAHNAEPWEEMHGRGHLYVAMMQYRGLLESANELGNISDTEATRAEQARLREIAAKIRAEMDKHWVEDPHGTVYANELRRRAEQMEKEANQVEGGNYQLGQSLRENADKLRKKAKAIEEDPNHPDYPQEERFYLAATLDSDATQTWHFEKTMLTDSISIIGLNHAALDGGPVPYRHSDSRWLQTIYVQEQQGRRLLGKGAEVDGVTAALRYFEDIWWGRDGANPEKKIGEYAWTLVTENFATYHYILRDELIQAGTITVDKFNLGFLRSLSRQGFPELARLEVGQTLSAHGPTEAHFDQVIEAINTKGDAYMKIAKKTYTDDGGSSEGFHPVTGVPAGPENLTWNLSEWLRAEWTRSTLVWANYQNKEKLPK